MAQYENVFRKAEAKELDASPRYVQERMRLLTDPWDWGKRKAGRKRLDWRLIAIVAALLLLSACAYAVVTGQFSQWFPTLGMNPDAPETSEDVLSRTGTVIQQSQTVGDTTVSLNSAVWDGEEVHLSLVIECPNIPEELTPDSPLAYSLYLGDCCLRLREDQWETYKRENWTHSYAMWGLSPGPELEADIQADLDAGQRGAVWLNVLDRESNTLTCTLQNALLDYVAQPELTLHLENIAPCTYDENGQQNPVPDEVFIKGPFDLTFTLERPIPPIQYSGADVEVMMEDILMRFREFKLSVAEMTASGEVLVPVAISRSSKNPDDLDKPTINDINDANILASWGIWTADGKYVELSSMGGGGGGGGGGENADGIFEIDLEHDYPYPIDPATITAVNVAGVRVGLNELKVVLTE